MQCRSLRLLGCLAVVLVAAPSQAHAQGSDAPGRVQVSAGGGLLTSGAYFTGPGDLSLSNGDAFVEGLQVSVGVHRSLALVAGIAHARPEWGLTGVPLIGSLKVPGGNFWLGDAALRLQVPLGRASRAASVFGQLGVGFAHYSLATSLLGTAIDEHATNVAVAPAVGLALPVARRFGLEVLAKDYIVSFRSVRDLAAFGIEGRRAHTLVLLVGGTYTP
jgi:hypothetical protein